MQDESAARGEASPATTETVRARTRLLVITGSSDLHADLLKAQAGLELRLMPDVSAAPLNARDFEPDLVVLDLDTLTGDPLLLCNRVRQILLARGRHVPFIALGAPSLLARVSPALDSTMDDMMIAPFTMSELMLRMHLRLRARQTTPVDSVHTRGDRYRILIVDDMPANVLLLEKYLERDYEVHVAYDGLTALSRAREVRPDLVLLDVRMPGMNGFQVCEALKRDEATRLTPVVMVTANADDRASKIQGLDRGADDFLIKPIDWPELSARVRNLIGVRALMERLHDLERERERSLIMRDVILAVTGGKLELTDQAGLQRLEAEAELLCQTEVRKDTDIALAREVAEKALMGGIGDEERVYDFVLCVSEASTNAVKHAGGGLLQVYRLPGRMQVWMRDNGKGIHFSVLPEATLRRGWSTKPSLGCGFTIMLDMLDRLMLHTSEDGTTVIMEMITPG